MTKIYSTLIAICCLSCSFQAFAQLNTRLVSNLTYNSETNDIWGYQAQDGTEYALVGLNTGVSIVSLANPSEPEEVAFVAGEFSRWRDIKTFGTFAYVTADEQNTREGLMIIDLSNLPEEVNTTNWNPFIEGETLNTIHNLYIDERGICYLAGSNISSGQVMLVDVATTPGQPQFITFSTPFYSHDVYVQNNMLYSSEIFEGRLSITDVSDPNNPQLLAVQQTPFLFTHNAWVSSDGNTVFTTDERANAPVAAYDISDINNIRFLDEFRPLATVNQGVIPHNVHVRDDYLVISHYTDGLVIVDASKPDNLIEVGNYDTSTDFVNNFHGAWGAYPFLPSGLILVSDIENGLFVIEPNYVRAALLEGMVTDSEFNQPLSDVIIDINTTDLFEGSTDIMGEFRTGLAAGGTYEITFRKTGFKDTTMFVDLVNGELTTLNITLDRKGTLPFQVNTFDLVTEDNIAGVRVQVQSRDTIYTGITNEDGNLSIDQIYEDEYEVIVGKWGYLTAVRNSIDVESTANISLGLSEGFKDDFILDLGWNTTNTAVRGLWTRATPLGTTIGNLFSNPPQDIEGDLGSTCYVTGNVGAAAGTDDVDNGSVTLISPTFNVSDITQPGLRFYAWFFNGGGSQALDDTLNVYLANRTDTVLIYQATGTGSNQWEEINLEIENFISIEEDLVFIAQTADQGNPHLVEAGIDGFLIQSLDIATSTSSEQLLQTNYGFGQVFPNPFKDEIRIELKEDLDATRRQLTIWNSIGQVVETIIVDQAAATVQWNSDDPAGLYFLQLIRDGKAVDHKKIIKR